MPPPSATSLLFVNQHYHPDVASTGQHLTDLAEHLAGAGYAVEVFTARGRYGPGRVNAPAREMRNGVEITRARSTAFGRRSHAGRVLDYASFYAQLARRLLVGPRPDGVIFLTTPPLLPFVGWLAKRARGQRYAVWSMDLHPDAAVAAGMLDARGLIARTLERASRLGYRGADFVVELGPYMKARLVAKGVDPASCRSVPVWSSRDEIEPAARADNPLRRRLGLGDRFVIMYSGNAGIVHDFDPILGAMCALRDDPGFFFLFVGGGPRRPEIEASARRHGLVNFRYLDYVERSELRHSLGAGDVHLVSLRAPFVGISVPGKLYGIMAAGRPVLFVGPERCESADTVRESGCGTVVDPAAGDAALRLVEFLRRWRADPVATRAMGGRGRAAFLSRYERAKGTRAFEAEVGRRWGGPRREAVR